MCYVENSPTFIRVPEDLAGPANVSFGAKCGLFALNTLRKCVINGGLKPRSSCI